MRDLVLSGIKVRVTKYKVIVYDDKNNVTERVVENIALYLKNEGFIKKDEFPIEIIKPSN